MGGHRWTQEANTWLRENYPALGAGGCYASGKLNRSYGAIRCQASALGISISAETFFRLHSVSSWARNWDCCQECGTTERPHVAKGLCQLCYSRKKHRQRKKCCADCGIEISPGATRCKSCDIKKRWKDGLYGDMDEPRGEPPLCACGCGEIVKWSKNHGRWNTYINHHCCRGKSLSEEHKYKISAANKGSVPWHKGKTGVYSKETLQQMSVAKKGQVPWCKGRKLGPHSEETKRRLREATRRAWARGDFDGVFDNDELHRRRSVAAKANWANGVYDDAFTSPTSIEIQIAAALDIMGIEHETQYRPEGYSRPYDELVLPNTLIEIQGDYWHGDAFPEQQQRDIEKAQWAEENGFEFMAIWEHEIKERGAWSIIAQAFG